MRLPIVGTLANMKIIQGLTRENVGMMKN
jgi:hypothetical protein